MTTSPPARLGILMLDSRFPRVPGDVGNPDSFDFPVRYKRVTGALPQHIVCEDPLAFTNAFIDAGRALIAEGCTGIATTCGFLSLMRCEMADTLGVPVASSALEQTAQVAAALPAGKRPGILTISAENLSQAHLTAAGVPAGTPIRGVENTGFARSILGNHRTLDVEAARADLVAAAIALVQDHPDVGAIILECTNMPPYAADICRATGRPVFSILTHLTWFHAGLCPPQSSA